MKRIAYIALFLFSFASGLMAQTEKGYWMINPQLTAFSTGSTDTDSKQPNRFNFGVGFKGDTFIYDDLLVSFGTGYNLDMQKKQWKENSLQLNGSVKYYFFSHLFLGAEIGYEHNWTRYSGTGQKTQKSDYYYVGADLGYAVFITRNISIDPALYWKYSFIDRLNQYGFRLGFSLYF